MIYLFNLNKILTLLLKSAIIYQISDHPFKDFIMETKYLEEIHFTTDFSQSKATALEIAHFLEKLDDLVKADTRLKAIDGCFGFYYPDDVESGIEDNRAELLSIISLSSSMSFKALTDDWFSNKSSQYYQLISQCNGLKIEIYCSEFSYLDKQFVRHEYNILVTPTGISFQKANETLIGQELPDDYVSIEVGYNTTEAIDENGRYVCRFPNKLNLHNLLR